MTDPVKNIKKELYDIAISKDILKRIDLIEKWVDDRVKEVSAEQIIIDRKYLTSGHEDALKYAMATKIAEKLLTDCGNVEVEGNKVIIKIVGICK